MIHSACLYALIFYDTYLYYKLSLSLFGFRSLFLFSIKIDLNQVLAIDLSVPKFCNSSKIMFWHFPIQYHFSHDQNAVLEAIN